MLRRGQIDARIIVPGAASLIAVLFIGPAIWLTNVVAAVALLTLGTGAIAAVNPPIDAAGLDVVPSGLWGRGEGGRMALRGMLEDGAPLLFGAMSGWLGGGEKGLEWTFLVMSVPVLADASLAIPARKPIHSMSPRRLRPTKLGSPIRSLGTEKQTVPGSGGGCAAARCLRARGSQMLQDLIQLCTSRTNLFSFLIFSDLAIAASYFAIPLTMVAVFSKRKNDIPYPWLWMLFVAFIVVCGSTHLVHVWSAFRGVENLAGQAAIYFLCAATSVGTAIAFAYILPQINELPSPTKQRAELERLVRQRTREKDVLIHEINHRIGNQLQILSSIVSRESRSAKSDEAVEILLRLKQTLDKMGEEHIALRESDYLAIAEINSSVLPSRFR